MRLWGLTVVTLVLSTSFVVWPHQTRAASVKMKMSATWQPVKYLPEAQYGRVSADSRSAALRVSAHPRFFVQEPPARFKQGADGAASTAAQASGYRSLGDPVSVQHELWSSRWFNQDLWFSDQWRTSNLRTYDAAKADVVLVPASLAIRDVESQVVGCYLRLLLPSFASNAAARHSRALEHRTDDVLKFADYIKKLAAEGMVHLLLMLAEQVKAVPSFDLRRSKCQNNGGLIVLLRAMCSCRTLSYRQHTPSFHCWTASPTS